jgi:hypothetical protein
MKKKRRKRISDGSHDANSHCPLKVAIIEALFVWCRMETQRARQGKVIKVQGDEAGQGGEGREIEVLRTARGVFVWSGGVVCSQS